MESNKTKEQLLTEVNQLKSRITKLEEAEIESKKVKDALRDSEEKHRLIGENIEAIVWEFNIPENRWTYLSPQVKRILGFSPDEFTDLQFWVDHIDLRDRDWASSYCATCTGKGESHEFEYRFLKKDGSFVWLRDIVQVEMTNNQPTLMRGLMIDISEKKNSEIVLKKSEENLKKTFNISPSIIAKANVITEFFTEVNQSVSRILGYSEKEFTSKPMRELIHPDDRQRTSDEVSEQLKGKETAYFENRYLCKDGTYKWIAWNTTKPDKNGVVTAIGTDISDRKQTETALLEANTIINRSPVVAFLWKNEENWPVEFVSKNVEDLFGYSVQEFINGSVAYSKIIHSDDIKKVGEEVSAASKKKSVQSFEHEPYRIVTKEGDVKWVQDKTVIRRDSHGKITHYDGIVYDISDFIQAERELVKAKEKAEESEEKLRSYIDNAPDGVIVVDENGRYLEVNTAAEKITGYSKAELLSMSLTDIAPLPQVGEYSDNSFSEVKETGGSKTEGMFLHKSGIKRWWSVDSVKLSETRYIGFVKDITERKKAEQKLLESEEKHRLLSENVEAILWEFTIPKNKWTHVSPQVKRILGYSPEEFTDLQFWIDHIHEGDRSWASKYWAASTAKGESYEFEYRFLKKDGSLVWLRDIVQVELLNDLPVKMRGLMIDITERKLAEEQIRKLSTAVEQSPATVVITDLKGNIEYVNPKFCETTGYSVEEAMSKNPRILKSGEKPSEEYKDMWETITSGKEWRGEFHNKRKNGELYWESASISPIRNDKGMITHYLAVKEDITERKKAEDELKENEARLLELNATKDKFFSIIGHDLKNPFNAILGFSGILMDQMKENNYDRIEEFASYIHESSKRAMDLLLNLLEWARSQTGKMEFNPEYADIAALINKTTQLLNDSARQKAITISSALPVKTNVFVDKAMVSTILRNLISNAVKFTNPGGEIVVSAELKQNELLVAVKDKGVGIGKNNLEKLFRIEESYSTTGTNNEKGTGLGLILCKEFIEKHKGKIWAESEEGVGSQFYFTIPYRTVKSKILENNEVDLKTKSAPKSKNLKILIAEDDEFADNLLSKILEDISKEILHAETGVKAVELFRKQPDIDLILMDNQMPVMSGNEATKQIREFNKDVIIIAQTALALAGDREKALEAGCNDYISKPINKKELLEKIENCLSKD